MLVVCLFYLNTKMSFNKIKQPSKAPLLTLLVLNSQNSHLVSAAELPSTQGDFGILLVLDGQVKEQRRHATALVASVALRQLGKQILDVSVADGGGSKEQRQNGVRRNKDLAGKLLLI